jgi:hypothetical protein
MREFGCAGAHPGAVGGEMMEKQESTNLPRGPAKTKGIEVLANVAWSVGFGSLLYPLGRPMARRGHRPGCGVGSRGRLAKRAGESIRPETQTARLGPTVLQKCARIGPSGEGQRPGQRRGRRKPVAQKTLHFSTASRVLLLVITTGTTGRARDPYICMCHNLCVDPSQFMRFVTPHGGCHNLCVDKVYSSTGRDSVGI